MKFNWMSAGVLREEAGAEGAGGGTGQTTKTTVTINGEEVPMDKVAAAHQLYKSLADEEVGKEIIEQLARRTMPHLFKDGDAPTNKETQQLENKFTKLMKAKLGKDYDKFSDLLGPVFDEAMESFKAELKSELSSTSEAGSWEGVVENFVSNNEFTPEIESKMQELIKRNGGRPQGLKGKAAKEYLTDMYELAIKKLGLVYTPDTEAEDEDEPVRRSRSKRKNVPEFREAERPKGPLTIDQIVDAAVKGIRFRN